VGALRGLAALEGPQVGGTVGGEPLRHAEARVPSAVGELQETDAREVLPLPVVGGLERADLPRLEERRGQLRAGLGGAEVVRVPDQVEDARRVPAPGGKIARQALAQPDRLADVEEAALPVEQ